MTPGRFDAAARPGDPGDAQVLVVGAGLAGLAVAAFLRRAGAEPVVVDERRSPDDGATRPVTLPPGGSPLDDLGVGDAVRAGGVRLAAWTVHDGSTPGGATRTVRPPAGRDPPVAADPAAVRTHLGRLVPDDAVHAGRAVRSLSQDGSGVRVEFADGVAERFDVVVGADGVRSRVRAAVGGPEPTPCGTRSWTATADADAVEEPRETWTRDGRAAVLTPVGDRTTCLLVEPADAGTDAGAAGPAADRFADLPGLPRSAVDSARSGTPTPDHRVPPGRRVTGRVALVGDAARAHHPVAGVGPALALADARGLAAALAGEGDPDARLADYADRCRRRHVRLERTAALPPESPRAVALSDRLPTALALRARLLGCVDDEVPDDASGWL